ncbi:MAG TPA: sulfite exporter TauE/SafE family protein [Micromonosporaceae bacterium]
MATLLAAFGIVLLGAVAQAVSGFGFAMVTVPLLAVATDPRTAVVVSALAGIGLTLTAAVRERSHARWRVAGALSATALLGLPVGLLILVLAPDRMLSLLIAVVVLGCAALVWSGGRIRTGAVGIGAIGVLVGVLTGATGTNGPPLVAAFHSLGYDPRTFRATLAATFSGTGVMGSRALCSPGRWTPAVCDSRWPRCPPSGSAGGWEILSSTGSTRCRSGGSCWWVWSAAPVPPSPAVWSAERFRCGSAPGSPMPSPDSNAADRLISGS